MRKILIVGAGQAGLHLAHGLLSNGYDVTVVTGRTSTEIRAGRPPLVGFSLPGISELEGVRHLDFWRAQAPRFRRVNMSLRSTSGQGVDFSGCFTAGDVTVVDRRIKMADWLEYFEDRGGKVVIHGVTVSDLDFFSRMYDLMVIAVGSGELGGLFDTAAQLSSARRRVVAQVLLEGVTAAPDEVSVVTAPWGEVFDAPVLTHDGLARAIMVTQAPGELLSWGERRPYGDHVGRVWAQVQTMLATCAPDVAARLGEASLIDGSSATIATVVPVVRSPVGVLPGGGRVLGIADVLCTSDPITARETSDATLCAEVYLRAILDHGTDPFTEAWMTATFDAYYQAHGRPVADYTRLLASWWDAPPPDHVTALLAAATQYPAVANHWIDGFADPALLTPLLSDPGAAAKLLADAGATPPP